MDALHHRPAVLLLIRLEDDPAVDPVSDPTAEVPDHASSPTWHRLAPAAHPGGVALAATIASGEWPEKHGLIRSSQPHVDRSSFVPASLEPTQLPVLWHDVVAAGGRATVIGWPHATRPPAVDAIGSLTWIDARTTAARTAGDEGSLPIRVGSVLPEDRRAEILAVRRASDQDLVLDLLERSAEEDPDLLVGFQLDSEGVLSRTRLAALVRRLEARRPGGVVVFELRQSGPAASILAGPRFEAEPRLGIRSHGAAAAVSWPSGRRVDAIAPAVRRVLAVEPTAPPGPAEPTPGLSIDETVGGAPQRFAKTRIDAFVADQQREIGLSLYARGEHEAAQPWVRAACEDRYGRLDPRLAVLLLQLAAPGGERQRLFNSLRPRLGEIADAWERCQAGDRVIEPTVAEALGPFVVEDLGLRSD